MSDVPVQLIVAAFQDEGDSLVVDDTGVYESKFIATPEGFAVELITATDDVVVDEIIVGIAEDEEDEE